MYKLYTIICKKSSIFFKLKNRKHLQQSQGAESAITSDCKNANKAIIPCATDFDIIRHIRPQLVFIFLLHLGHPAPFLYVHFVRLKFHFFTSVSVISLLSE